MNDAGSSVACADLASDGDDDTAASRLLDIMEQSSNMSISRMRLLLIGSCLARECYFTRPFCTVL